MSLIAILALAAQAAPTIAAEAPAPQVVVVRGTATTEIVRAGRSGEATDPDEVVPQRRRTANGAMLNEYR